MVTAIQVAGDWIQGEFKFVGETSLMQTGNPQQGPTPACRAADPPGDGCGSPGRWTGGGKVLVSHCRADVGAAVPSPPRGKGTHFGSTAAVRQGSSRESGSSVVLGSKLRLERFTLAPRCWSCLLPGWGGRGGSVPPIPAHRRGVRAQLRGRGAAGSRPFWRMLFGVLQTGAGLAGGVPSHGCV